MPLNGGLPSQFGRTWNSAQNRWNLLVQKLSLEPWKTPTLLNAWVNYGLGNLPASYRKGYDGRVYLRGLVKRPGAIAAFSNPIFVLPEDFRPISGITILADHGFTAAVGMKQIRVDIGTDGTVTVGEAAEYVYLGLNNLSFYPD